VKRFINTSVLAMMVLALTAALGAASASAGTVLCDESKVECTSPAIVAPAGTWFETAQTHESIGSGFTLTGGVNNYKDLECGTSFINAKTTKKNANPLPATTATGLNPKYCTTFASEGKACSTAGMNAPNATLEATATGGVVRVGSASEPLTVSYSCYNALEMAEFSCTYAAKGAVEMVYNRETGNVTVSNAPMVRTAQSGPAFCHGETKLNLTHQTHNWFISKAVETVLCSALESPCAEGNVLPAGKYLQTGGSASNALEVRWAEGQLLRCTSAVMSFKTLSDGGAPALAATPYSNVPSYECFGFGEATKTCTSTTLSVPSATLEATGAGTGVVRLGTSLSPVTVSFTCGTKSGTQTCSYKATETVKLNIGSTGATTFNAPLVRTSGTCAEKGTLSLVGSVGGDGFLSKRG
jgi:hypothetical protein